MPKSRFFFFASLILYFLVAPCRADNLDNAISAEMTARHIPGAAVAVVRNGKVTLSKGYGMANIEKSAPVTPETEFLLGSIGKQFTAMAIMMLAEEGKISLDAKVVKYLLNFPETYNEVTVRHLLSHSSGIKRDFKAAGLSVIGDPLYKAMASSPLEFKPGERVSYSNTGYILLGLLIESVGNKSYGEFLAERIFKPLGMASTKCFNSGKADENWATGYEWENNNYRKLNYVISRYGAGSIVSTLSDMVKWDAALNTEKLVKTSTLNLMWTPFNLNSGKAATMGNDYAARRMDVGFGWFMSDYFGHKVIHHGGAIDGYSSQIDRFVNDKISIIVLCNNEGGPAAALAKIVADSVVPNRKLTSIAGLNQRATFAYQQRDFASAAKLYVAAADKGDKEPNTLYNAACCFSLIGEKENAYSYLEKAIKLGFKDAELLKRDTDLDPLRGDPRWATILKMITGKG